MALQKASADAFNFTATANTTTVFSYKLIAAYYVKGIQFISSNANVGDSLKIELVDIDNILGLGEGAVLGTPIKKAFIQSTVNSQPISADNPEIVKLPAPNLYIRVSYTNTSLLTGVSVYINLKIFEDA